MPKRLEKLFFNQACDVVAKSLLGKVLCRKLDKVVLKGRVVETEMYPGAATDGASHNFSKKKPKQDEAAAFVEPGSCYVRFTYGMYFCFNIRSADDGCILIRALEPVEGLEAMKLNRTRGKKSTDLEEKNFCNGPSKLCQALDITKANSNELDLTTSPDMWLEEGPEVIDFQASKRIGIDRAGSENVNKLYRFYEKQNIHVSVIDKEEKASSNKTKTDVASPSKKKEKEASPRKKKRIA